MIHALAAESVTSRDEGQGPESRSTAEISRQQAVDRVFKGALLSMTGLVSFGVGVAVAGLTPLSYLASYAFGFAGMVAAGVGFGLIGAAARHFARFGSPRVTLALGASVGLGVSTIVLGITGLAPVLEQLPFIRQLAAPAMFAVLGFGAFIVLLTLGALLRWLMDSGD